MNNELTNNVRSNHSTIAELMPDVDYVSAGRTKADIQTIVGLLKCNKIVQLPDKKQYKPMAQASQLDSESKRPTKSPMNVLLIEDSALIRNVINESLEECTDISISTYAETQHHAIELLKLEQFDMLLVDIELSQGNGFEVIKFAQSAEYLFSPPVIIILTNNASSYYRLMAKQLGVNFFFDKSMDFDLAIETITNVAFKFTHPH